MIAYARATQPTEFVNFRAVHTYPLPRPLVRPPASGSGREGGAAGRTGAGAPASEATIRCVADARLGERRAYFAPAGFVSTDIYDRARLPLGARVTGPAIIQQSDTTTVVPPHHVAEVEASGNLRLRRAP